VTGKSGSCTETAAARHTWVRTARLSEAFGGRLVGARWVLGGLGCGCYTSRNVFGGLR
jgi:hypothetical protein